MRTDNVMKLPTSVNGQEYPIKRVSNLRNVASQSFALFANCLLKFTFGNFLGLTTTLLPLLFGENAETEILMTKSQYTWFSSYLWMEPVGAIIVGPLAHFLGSRTTLLIASVLSSGCWIMFYLAHSAAMMMTAQAVVGMTKAFILGPSVTYIVEISQPHLRSTLMATNSLCIILGSFFTVLISKWVTWRTVALINLVFAVLGFAAIFCIPDSPHFLAAKGKSAEAQRSLAWLRGWTTTESVQAEFQLISKAHSSPSLVEKRGWKSSFAPYFGRAFLLPLGMVFFLFVLDAVTGGHTLQAYSMKIFEKIEAPLDEHVASILFEGMRVAGAVVCIFVVHSVGKKNLCLFSFGGAGICYVIVAVFTLLLSQRQLTARVYYWIPPLMIITATFVVAAGSDKVVNILNGELFPMKYRNVGTAIGTFVNFTSGSIMKKVFEYMIDAITLQGVFLFFAVACLVGIVGIYVMIPETEGRTLMEIENHFSGVKSLNDRSVDKVGEGNKV